MSSLALRLLCRPRLDTWLRSAHSTSGSSQRHYPVCCSYRFANSRRNTFPINVRGKSSMKITKRGTRWAGRRRLAYSITAFERGRFLARDHKGKRTACNGGYRHFLDLRNFIDHFFDIAREGRFLFEIVRIPHIHLARDDAEISFCIHLGDIPREQPTVLRQHFLVASDSSNSPASPGDPAPPAPRSAPVALPCCDGPGQRPSTSVEGNGTPIVPTFRFSSRGLA